MDKTHVFQLIASSSVVSIIFSISWLWPLDTHMCLYR